MARARDRRRSTHARRPAVASVVACAVVSCMAFAVVAAAAVIPTWSAEVRADTTTAAQAVVRAATVGQAALPSMSPDVARARRPHGVAFGSLLVVLVATLATVATVRPATLVAVASGGRRGSAGTRPGASRAPPRPAD